MFDVHVAGRSRSFDRVRSEWGLPTFISLKSFKSESNGYLVNDTCFFGVEVFVIKNSGFGEALALSEYNVSHKHEWKIPQFSKLGDSCQFNQFVVGGFIWYISNITSCLLNYTTVFLFCLFWLR